jgi:hypothetical protein
LYYKTIKEYYYEKSIKNKFDCYAMLISMSVSAKINSFSISLTEANSKTLRFEIFNAENVSLYFYNDRKDEIIRKISGTKRMLKNL